MMENPDLGDFFGESNLRGEKLELEDAVVEVLVKVMERVDWKKISRGRDPLDVIQHRVLASAYSDSFERFLDKFCYSLGIQSLRLSDELLDLLKNNSTEAIELIRRSSIFLVARAYNLYKSRKIR